ncbi:hypothetical protein BGY98DRAFT_932336 [Russula aff. rugulosa BPL654]|nr:hypothetical protein BGY98DRAFT_932336 [Russula aff. rugulosa BPL654]
MARQLVQYRPDQQKKSDGATRYQLDVIARLQHAKTRHTVNCKPASVTLPTQVAPGDYLVHHKIIALHLAVMLGRAEPVPSILHLSGNGLSLSPGGNSSPSPTAKNGKPMSTNGAGSGSGAQSKGIA